MIGRTIEIDGVLIHFEFFEHPLILARAEELVSAVVAILPHWTKQVYVHSKIDPPNNECWACSISQAPEYRQLTVTMYASFWDLPPSCQIQNVLHEFAHSTVGGLTEWVKVQLLAFIGRRHPDVAEVLQNQFIMEMESTVESLTWTLMKVMQFDWDGAIKTPGKQTPGTETGRYGSGT